MAAVQLLAQRQCERRHEALRLGQQQERSRQIRLRLQTLPALLASLALPLADEQQRRVLDYWATDAPSQLRDDEAAMTMLDLRQRVLAFELVEMERRC